MRGAWFQVEVAADAAWKGVMRSHRKAVSLLAIGAVSVVSQFAMAGTIAIDVRPSSAPNAFGSPSWSTYVSNAMSSLTTGGGNVGSRATDPTAYEVLGATYEPGDVMVTSFNSWRGVAAPGAPFASEYGNRLHFGLVAVGDGTTTFTLADVLYSVTSTDSVLDFAGNLAGTTLNGTTRVGLYYGADRALGGGDDVWYTSGESDATVLDALYYVGVGNAYWPGGPGDPLTGQAAIDSMSSYIQSNQVGITGLYTIKGSTGAVSLTPAPIPLPSSALMGIGLLGGLGVLRLRRRRSTGV